MIENVQKFAPRMHSKQWDTGYFELLYMFDLSSLENWHLYLKLCHLFKLSMVYATSFQMLLSQKLVLHILPDTLYFSSPSLEQTPIFIPLFQALFVNGTIFLLMLLLLLHLNLYLGYLHSHFSFFLGAQLY